MELTEIEQQLKSLDTTSRNAKHFLDSTLPMLTEYFQRAKKSLVGMEKTLAESKKMNEGLRKETEDYARTMSYLVERAESALKSVNKSAEKAIEEMQETHKRTTLRYKVLVSILCFFFFGVSGFSGFYIYKSHQELLAVKHKLNLSIVKKKK